MQRFRVLRSVASRAGLRRACNGLASKATESAVTGYVAGAITGNRAGTVSNAPLRNPWHWLSSLQSGRLLHKVHPIVHGLFWSHLGGIVCCNGHGRGSTEHDHGVSGKGGISRASRRGMLNEGRVDLCWVWHLIWSHLLHQVFFELFNANVLVAWRWNSALEYLVQAPA